MVPQLLQGRTAAGAFTFASSAENSVFAFASTMPVKDTVNKDSATARARKTTYKNIERRREQNRVNAQKSYYRKLRTLETLRDEVAALERLHETQMQALKGSSDHGSVDGYEESKSSSIREAQQEDDMDRTASDSQVNYRHELQQLVATHKELQEENQVLQELHDLHVRFQCRVQLLADADRVSYGDISGDQSDDRSVREVQTRSPLQMDAQWWVWPSDSTPSETCT